MRYDRHQPVRPRRILTTRNVLLLLLLVCYDDVVCCLLFHGVVVLVNRGAACAKCIVRLGLPGGAVVTGELNKRYRSRLG